MAAFALISVAKYACKQVQRLPLGLVDVVRHADLPPDVFRQVVESTAKIFDSKAKLPVVVDAILARWAAAQSADVNTVPELCLCLNGLVGLARANADLLGRVFEELRAELGRVTEQVGQSLLEFAQQSYAMRHEEMHSMLDFLRAEFVLFSELRRQDCSDVMALYAELPAEMRLPEALQLVEVLLRVGLKAEAAAGLHETVIAPTEAMVLENDPDQYVEHSKALARVLVAIANNYWATLAPDDVRFLLNSVHQTNQVVVFETIKAIDACVEKADMKLMGDERAGFFREFLC
jgi:hypothetical protein